MIKFNMENNLVEDFTFLLSGRDYKHYGEIKNIDDFHFSSPLNSADEFSLLIYKELDEKEEKLWEEIRDFQLIYIKELDKYFEIHIVLDETENGITKKITGTSLCEAELSQCNLYNIEINTEEDIAREDYVVTTFYNEDNHEGSLLHRILDKAPHYSIKHVDASLVDLQRSFSISSKSIYDFFSKECSEQIGCLFIYDSTDRSISVYDLYTVCKDCGYRGEYGDVCPKCGSTNLSYYGEDTTILVSVKNLTDEITFETNVDKVKNCFKLRAGDDTMTAAVINNNPNGSAYIYYFSEEQKKNMPTDLVQKMESYDALYESRTEEYENIMVDLYNCLDKIIYYTSSMMPTIEHEIVTPTTESAKLTTDNLNGLALSKLTQYTSVDTVNSAIKNYAKVYINTGQVKLEINTSTFTYNGINSSGYNCGTWTGNFKVTDYSDKENFVYSSTITITVTDNYSDFIEQKIYKELSNTSEENGIFDVLSIKDLSSFKNALTYYSLNRLKSFYDAIQSVIDILIGENQSNSTSELYDQFYVPYYNKLVACQDEIDVRSATITQYETQKINLEEQQKTIQKDLNFETYLGEELFKVFCSYRREDEYSNDNYISDGLNNEELLKHASDFIKEAKLEIIKSCETQHTISANLKNLLAMDEFTPIVDKFENGNWIRLEIDDEIYRLRLISYEISANDFSSINTEFSDITKNNTSINQVQSIFKNSQSMATTYTHVSKQASKGENANKTFDSIKNEGLDSSLYTIKNANTEEIIYNKHGLTARSYDDTTGGYLDEQLKVTHNTLCFTDDNWATVRAALGKQKITIDGHTTYQYGLCTNQCIYERWEGNLICY